jgi:hypothetical protein
MSGDPARIPAPDSAFHPPPLMCLELLSTLLYILAHSAIPLSKRIMFHPSSSMTSAPQSLRSSWFSRHIAVLALSIAIIFVIVIGTSLRVFLSSRRPKHALPTYVTIGYGDIANVDLTKTISGTSRTSFAPPSPIHDVSQVSIHASRPLKQLPHSSSGASLFLTRSLRDSTNVHQCGCSYCPCQAQPSTPRSEHLLPSSVLEGTRECRRLQPLKSDRHTALPPNSWHRYPTDTDSLFSVCYPDELAPCHFVNEYTDATSPRVDSTFRTRASTQHLHSPTRDSTVSSLHQSGGGRRVRELIAEINRMLYLEEVNAARHALMAKV